ncbi:hypothetical protein A2U01_0116479, partial [Trifolium medium]|nr:hypothetical protein [Trifolium medium]
MGVSVLKEFQLVQMGTLLTPSRTSNWVVQLQTKKLLLLFIPRMNLHK